RRGGGSELVPPELPVALAFASRSGISLVIDGHFPFLTPRQGHQIKLTIRDGAPGRVPLAARGPRLDLTLAPPPLNSESPRTCQSSGSTVVGRTSAARCPGASSRSSPRPAKCCRPIPSGWGGVSPASQPPRSRTSSRPKRRPL